MSHVYINPVNNCQLCNAEFNAETPMYDCRLIPHTTWANICEDCFNGCNCKLGVGYGQKYELQELESGNKAWVKVES